MKIHDVNDNILFHIHVYFMKKYPADVFKINK